jgi:uncharacterized protein
MNEQGQGPEGRGVWSAEREARFGVGLRREHFDDILDRNAGVDFLEILPENYMDFGGRPRDVLRKVAQRFPVVTHGVSLSIGSLDPLNETYLDKLASLIQELNSPWFSDHLSYSSNFGVEYHDLLPLPFTEEALGHVVTRVRKVQDRIKRPFLLENPSYYAMMPGAEMSEAEFLGEIAQRADCGILLDVNNVYVNAQNHDYDARDFIKAMPASRVLQYHIAGHDDSRSFLVDTHGAAIIEEVFELFAYTLKTLGPAWTLLEWDNNIPPVDDLLRENAQVRAVAARALDRPELEAGP